MSQHCDDSVSGKVREFCEENLLNGAMHLHDSPCDFEYQGPIRLDDALEMYAGRQTETLQSEIETLKAQLATANNEIRRLRNVAGGQSIQLRVSEAQVRELRELLTKAANLLDFGQSGVIFNPRNLLLDIQAALRSAPPSDPVITVSSGAPPAASVDCMKPKWVTNAGEERNDLAKDPAARTDETRPVESAPLGELTARSGDGNQSPTQKERVGPQDSPSRSEWISVEERLPENERLVLAFAPQIDSDLDSEIQVAWYNGDAKHCKWEGEISRLDEKVTHWQPLPTAPPSPTREKEKAE